MVKKHIYEIDEELVRDFKKAVKEEHSTVVSALRWHMREEVKKYKRKQGK